MQIGEYDELVLSCNKLEKKSPHIQNGIYSIVRVMHLRVFGNPYTPLNVLITPYR